MTAAEGPPTSSPPAAAPPAAGPPARARARARTRARARIEMLLHRMDEVYAEGRGDWFASLAEALAGVTAEQAAWSPGHGSHTIWQLVNHIAYWKEWGTRKIGGEPFRGLEVDNAATFGDPGDRGDAAGWQAALDRLHRAQRDLRTAVARLSDADLDAPIPGGKEPMWRLVAGLIEHDAHHGGQVIYIRKLQGSWKR